MPRETAAQRRTRISLLLGEYDAVNRDLRKLSKIREGLKEQIKDIPTGDYGDWTLSAGTPREITDQTAIKARYAELGEALPTKLTDAPIIVTPKAGKK